MSDIFVTYAREDEDRVRELVSVLEQQGWSVFWDRRIPTGETWRSYKRGRFELLSKRWIVERTFGWFNRCRRLSKGYAYLTECSEDMIHLAITHLMLRHLHRTKTKK